jgi:hypothetical protein
MCKYCKTTNYRKIYENHHGPIPTDDNSKSYDIHHIDFDKTNNAPDNLIALTINDHYDLHYSFGHYNACRLISKQRMNKSAEELSLLAKKAALKMIEDGIHPWVGDGSHQRRVQADRIADGTHNLLGPTNNMNNVANGTHPNMRRPDGTSTSMDRVKNGTHNWQKRSDGSSVAYDLVKKGTHHFLGKEITNIQLLNGTHPSQQVWKCEKCGKEGKHKGAYNRFHGNKCRWSLQ